MAKWMSEIMGVLDVVVRSRSRAGGGKVHRSSVVRSSGTLHLWFKFQITHIITKQDTTSLWRKDSQKFGPGPYPHAQVQSTE